MSPKDKKNYLCKIAKIDVFDQMYNNALTKCRSL